MNATELREKNIEQLGEALIELHKEQFNLKMQKVTGQLNSPHKIKEVRRTIARVNMVISEKRVNKI
jgi:large subunit ribosomal protein L29